MNDQPNSGDSSPPAADSATRDPALADPGSGPTRPVMPIGTTIADNVAGNTGALPELPDLSIGTGSSSAGSRSEPEPPKLDGYDVVARIGEGGMGTVWRGVQASTRRNVALKLISAAGFASEKARHRFDREVELTARLEHPNIARVYDSGINRGVYFYAMELIDGVPLDQYVSRHHLSRPNILRLFAVICRAVDHAHQRGVIHRDLKPGNILVSPEGQPHVLDFGLAKAMLQAGVDSGISLAGEVAGTPGFMAPEQAAGKADVDARCDVYSLGVILYRLLTGQSPHDLSGNYLDVLRRVSEEEPKRPRAVDRSMDRDLEALLLHAMQRDPLHRYKTAGELAQDVEHFLAGDPIAAKPPSTIYFLRKRAHKHRMKLTALAIVVGLVAVATLLSLSLRKSHQDKDAQQVNDQLRVLAKEREEENATGKAAVSKGDIEFNNGKWVDARGHYLEALPHFAKADSSALTAELGLWDVARIAPQAILTIPFPRTNGKTADFAVTGGALVFLDKGRSALAGCDDGTLRMWDVTSGRMLGDPIKAHRGAVRSIAVSADGKFVLSAGADGALTLSNVPSGIVKTDFAKPPGGWPGLLTRVALSGDARFALSASGASAEALQQADYHDHLTLWDAAGGRPLFSSDSAAGVLDVKGSITQAAFSPDSTKLLTIGAEIVVWNTADGKRLKTLPETAMSAALSSDGQWIAAGSSDGGVHFVNIATGEISKSKGAGHPVSALWFDRDNDRIITAGEDGAFRASDLQGSERWALPPIGDINAVAISPDASIALTAADDGLSVWRLAPPLEARELAANGPFPDVSLSRDGRIALSRSSRRVAGSAAEVVLWDTATGKTLTPAGFPTNHCNGVALSGDGRTIARAEGSGLSIWSLDPPHEVRRFTIKPARSVSDGTPVVLSGDGTKVALAAADNSILLYRIDGPTEPQVLAGHTALVTSLGFSADGRIIVSGSEDLTARAWDAQTGKTLVFNSHAVVMVGHDSAINAIAISDDGKMVLTASGPLFQSHQADNSVRLWDAASGKPLFKLSDGARMRSVAFSGDGRLIAAGGDEGTVILWDSVTHDALRTIHTQQGPVISLSFDQTGQSLSCGANNVSLWNLALPALRRPLQQAIAAGQAKDSSRPLDAADFLAFGRWYALAGKPDWALSFFEQARAAGQTAPPLESFRCHWESGDFDAADVELNSVSAQEAPAFYVKLCREAVRRDKERSRH